MQWICVMDFWRDIMSVLTIMSFAFRLWTLIFVADVRNEIMRVYVVYSSRY